ncbi:MAG TPA: divergent polysaccharide deacetylase family protein [Candidatus Cloacimonadota bacterium]|nr:divergent polysaccharide deacetylase family protein [Candidatus Cloacimonadota bacterium]
MAKRKVKRKSRKKKKKQIKKIYLITGVLILLALLLLAINLKKIISFGKEVQTAQLEVKQIVEERTVLDAIMHSKRLMGVSDKNFKHYVGNDAIFISIGIDRNEMDLNYANMILSGQVEMENGTVLSGEEKDNGNKQVIRIRDNDDQQIYQVTLFYQKSAETQKPKTKLAIVVDDFGIHNDKILEKFCSLDKNITFAILPEQKYSETVMTKAAEFGHETIIHIPMEPVSYPKNNPGNEAIFVHLSQKEIIKRLEKFIKQLPLCIGASNHMGSLVTTDESVMRTVLSVLKEHNLFFIDSRTSTTSIAYDLAKEMIIPTFESSLFLDTPDISDKTMNSKISILKNMFKTHDKILVITHCATEERYQYLKKFVEKISQYDIELIPLSQLFQNDLPEIL